MTPTPTQPRPLTPAQAKCKTDAIRHFILSVNGPFTCADVAARVGATSGLVRAEVARRYAAGELARTVRCRPHSKGREYVYVRVENHCPSDGFGSDGAGRCICCGQRLAGGETAEGAAECQS